MFIDNLLKVSSAQALSATAYSTDTVDSSQALRDVSVGEPLVLAVEVDTAADFTTTDETYEIQIVQSANSNLSSHDVLVSRVIDAADLSAGSLHYIPFAIGNKDKQYLGVRYVLGGTSPSVTVSAFFQPQSMIQVNKVYADNITIS